MISLEAFLSIGLMVGSLLSSFVYAATSATFTFSLSGVLMCLATAYIALYVPESLKFKTKEAEINPVPNCCKDIPINCNIIELPLPPNDHEKSKNDDKDCFHDIELRKDNETQKRFENVNLESKTKNGKEDTTADTKSDGLFSYKHVKDMWITCFKSRPYYDRSIILLVTGTMFLAIFVLDGAMTVFYLFVREKFQWTVREFTFYETISHVTSVFGALIGFLILRKVSKKIFRCIKLYNNNYSPFLK